MLEYLIKIGVSLLCGLLIGWEREKSDKPAGLRTITLVCLGTTLFAMIGLEFVDKTNVDMARLFYAPIVGIGFLGSGIFIRRNDQIDGITTAGVLWVLVAIGLLVGIGKFLLAIITTLVVYLVLMLKYVEIKVKCKRRVTKNGNKRK